MIWRFGEFELDDSRFELRRAGERAAIAPKPLAVLLHLARRHPVSVSHEELFRAVWPGVRVTAGSLARAVRAARQAFGQGKDDEGVIRTVRGRGYALGDILSPDRGPHAVLPTDAPFVGRVRELACIETTIDEVEAGSGRLLFISGEAGIGKSRLLEELVSRATLRGLDVFVGDCREGQGTPPYWPWPDIVGNLIERRVDPALVGVLQRLDLAVDPSSGAELSATDGAARFRLLNDVTQGLRQAARNRPLVVAIEDLHWAEAAPLQLLRFAGRSLARSAILLAVTFRRSGPPPNAELEAAVGELAGLSHAVPELCLAGLSEEEIGAYYRYVAGRDPEPGVVAYLGATAGGNPLFLRELVPLVDAPGSAVSAAPASVGHVVRSQVQRLSRPSRGLIELAAIVGREFSPGFLARAAGRSFERSLDLLEEARGENLVDWSSAERKAMQFRHDIVRAAIGEAVGPSRRIDMHRRIAEAIESGHVAEPQLARLAHHYSEAIPQIGCEKAIHFSALAAEASRRALDFDGASSLYRQALAALEHDRAGEVTRRRCDLLLGLGEVLELGGRSIEARATIAAAADLARRLRSWPRLTRAALSLTRWERGVFADPLALRLTEDALKAVGKRNNDARARLLSTLAVMHKVEGAASTAGELIDEAVALAKRLDDPPLLCDVLAARLLEMQIGIPGDYQTRLELTVELLEAARRAGNIDATLQCRRLRVALFLILGAGKELDDEIELFARDSSAARRRQYYATGFRAIRAVIVGRFEEARWFNEELDALADPLSPEESRFTPTGQRVDMPPEHRDSEAVLLAIHSLNRDYPTVTGWRVAMGLVALDLGQIDVARDALDDVAANDFALVPRNLNYTLLLACLARISWRLGERRYASDLYDRLLPHAGTIASSGMGLVYQGPVDWHLGVLAMLSDRAPVAARHFDDSLAITTRLGAKPWHATTELTYAALLADGSASDRRRAAGLATSAAKAAAGLGMHSLRAEAELLTARLSRAGKTRVQRR